MNSEKTITRRGYISILANGNRNNSPCSLAANTTISLEEKKVTIHLLFEDHLATHLLNKLITIGSRSDKSLLAIYLNCIMTESEGMKIPGDPSGRRITDTELCILCLIYDGNSSKDIANLLCRSHYTIRGHYKKIYRKIGVNNKVAASKYFETHFLKLYTENHENTI